MEIEINALFLSLSALPLHSSRYEKYGIILFQEFTFHEQTSLWGASFEGDS